MISAERELLSVLRFPTLTDVQTEHGSLMLSVLRLSSRVLLVISTLAQDACVLVRLREHNYIMKYRAFRWERSLFMLSQHISLLAEFSVKKYILRSEQIQK